MSTLEQSSGPERSRGVVCLHGTAVAVNVSARQLDDPGFAGMVIDTLRDTSLPGHALILEITESGLMATSTANPAMAQLDRLRTHHIRIAIDDFGAGYSSLSYLARLPVDIVKIDSSFAPGLTQGDSPDWAFSRAIFDLVTGRDRAATPAGPGRVRGGRGHDARSRPGWGGCSFETSGWRWRDGWC
jgi:EAL domain-containing protein (putative c-di-GMP-specific phosphodiesterase class I)